MPEFNTGLPSVRQVQEFIKDKQEVEVKLSTGDLLVGRLRWQDSDCLCLMGGDERSLLIWRQAVVYLKPTG